MDILSAPYKTNYIGVKKDKSCVFCDIFASTKPKTDFGILYKDTELMILMNKFPYSPGHILIVPICHIDNLEDLELSLWLKMSKALKQASSLLKDVLNAKGLNIGMNLAKAGGAGIEEHIHCHILPRWDGDTNFITSIGNARVYRSDFDEIYKKLLKQSSKYFKLK